MRSARRRSTYNNIGVHTVMEPRAVRQAASNLLSILRLVASIHMLWKAITCLTNCPCPIAVVTSESMEPAFHRGDIIFLYNRQQYINIGDIPVLWFENRKLPMVCDAHDELSWTAEITDSFSQTHRAIATHFLSDEQNTETVV